MKFNKVEVKEEERSKGGGCVGSDERDLLSEYSVSKAKTKISLHESEKLGNESKKIKLKNNTKVII